MVKPQTIVAVSSVCHTSNIMVYCLQIYSGVNDMSVGYECSELIEELKSDIAEFGGDLIVAVWCKDCAGRTLYTNYDFIVEEEPLHENEVLPDEYITQMSMSALLVVLKSQNKIV